MSKMPIYQPAEDSYLLSETLKDFLKNLKIENNNINNPNKKDKFNNHNKHSRFNHHNYLNIHNINDIKILDMGSGSGIQAETCRKAGFKNILTADINPESIKLLKQNGFKSIKSNLFENINKNNKFNLIIFNPPYLPEDKLEPKDSRIATTGGKIGYEIVLRFLKQAKNHLNKQGIILLLISSLTNPKIIEKTIKKLSYDFKIINKKRFFFEELFVYDIFIKT